MAVGINKGDDAVTRLVLQDTLPWYRKSNLRYLYLVMIPTCVGVEMTSGYAKFFLDSKFNTSKLFLGSIRR